MARVVHFEISADDPERAAQFYRGAFGWEIKKWEGPVPYWLATTGPENEPGISGAIMEREHPLSGKDGLIGYRCTIDISSVDESVARVSEHGGSVVAPKMAVPGVGWMALCKDTEGNIFGLMESDESAQ